MLPAGASTWRTSKTSRTHLVRIANIFPSICFDGVSNAIDSPSSPHRCHCAMRAIDCNLIHTPSYSLVAVNVRSLCAVRVEDPIRNRNPKTKSALYFALIFQFIFTRLFLCAIFSFFLPRAVKHSIQYILVMSWQHNIWYSNFLMDSTVSVFTWSKHQLACSHAKLCKAQCTLYGVSIAIFLALTFATAHTFPAP